jgi:subtilisin family serine protease
VLVGVIDTGIDYNHPDLAANVFTNPGEIPGNGIDDEGNGYIDDVHGYDFVNGDSDPLDDHYHGSHVSGTIGAVGNNGIGVAGVPGRRNSGLQNLQCMVNHYGILSGGLNAMMACVVNSWGTTQLSGVSRDAASILFIIRGTARRFGREPRYPSSCPSQNIVAVAARLINGLASTGIPP